MDHSTKNILRISTLFTVLLIVSCTEHFEELNTDPNYPTDVPASSIFTQVIINSVDAELNEIVMAMWSQQWSAAQYSYADRYITSGYNFSSNYINELLDLEIIMRKAEDLIDKGSMEEIRRNRALLAATKIMRVWIFHFLTDMLGDLPYSEAVSGLDQDVIYTPKYDTQESIYMDFLKELDEANTLLDLSSVSNFGKGDLFFGGDPLKWKKFGNSLRLRILNRCAGTPWSFTYNMVGPGEFTTGPGAVAYNNADNEIAAILGDLAVYPVISANDDNVCLTYPGLPDYRQPIYDRLYTRLDFVISETMVEWLKARNDPRLHVYAQVTQDYKDTVSTEPYVGEQNGRNQLSSYFPGISLLGTAVGYDEDAPLYILTYDEIEFIKAEHYLRLGDDTRARTAYEAGIGASMDRWGVNLDNYLDEPKINWDSAFSEGERYQRILEQKWAGIFGQGAQAWNEVRRTGFPARIFEYELEWTYFPDLGLPIRKQYPSSEERDNGLNHDEAIKRQNIESRYYGMFSTDGIKSQMWWHTRKNPIPTEIDPPVI